MRRASLLAVAAALVIAAAGGARAERPTDAVVTDWVEEAIAADPRVRGEQVEVATRGGIVTLSGSVETLAGRRYAVLAAQKILGVLGVIDQLEIEATPFSDADVAEAVRWRIAKSQSIEVRNLAVTSKQGVVRLAGDVRSGSQRHEAELLASEVAGVRGVESFLEVEPDASQSDPRIQKDVEAALRRDVYLARLPISVAVKGGDVTLTGTVGSAYERTRASSRIRWVDGVRDISNQLQVEWWEDRAARLAAPEPRSDAELAATVLEQLRQDVRIDAGRIQVGAESGRVELQGVVASLSEKRLAEEDAWNVAGVGWVANEIDVAAVARPDAEIAQEIRSAIAGDSELAGTKIEVGVKGGAVTLEGAVTTGYQRVHAGAIAARTRGVEGLDNRLRAATWRERGDDELAAEVTRRLARNWRTASTGERIDVRVEAGVVTLTGTVERWTVRRSAARVAAATRGVRRVRNRIVVQPYAYPWDERTRSPDSEGEPDWLPHDLDDPELPWIANLPFGRKPVTFRGSRGEVAEWPKALPC